jgi:hypothetical protein
LRKHPNSGSRSRCRDWKTKLLQRNHAHFLGASENTLQASRYEFWRWRKNLTMVRMFVIALNGYYALTTVLGHKENTFIWVQRSCRTHY